MVTRKGKVRNAYGIHCRPSGVISKEFKDYKGHLEVIGPSGTSANPRSVLSLLSLALTKDAPFEVRAEGEGEKEACDRLVQLLESEYDFEKQ